MKWFFEKWKKYRAIAVLAVVLGGGSGAAVVTALDGIAAVHDEVREQLQKAPEPDSGS